VPVEHADFGGLDDPSSLFRPSGVESRAGEDVVETFGSDIYPIAWNFDGWFIQADQPLLSFIPPPGIQNAVASGAILENIDVCGGNRSTACFLNRVFCGAK
jgi:hypothetical protein